LGARSRWPRVRLAVNTANLAASTALVAGVAWAWLGERGWPAPVGMVRAYGPILAALQWYGSEPAGAKALGALTGMISLFIVLACILFSFKVHMEEIVVMLLGIPFYLLIACSCFLVASLVASLIRLLFH
jgi:hypothetical protein